ncbi:MAG: peptidoglycan recognition family protein [Pseudomonadota bacterium]
MKRIVFHWTGGSYTPNAAELKAYHFLIDGDGNVHDGDLPPEANSPASVKRGTYARHTGGLNTDSIGVGLCGMFGAKEGGPYGKYPIKKGQFAAAIKEAAHLCEVYGLSADDCVMHSEVRPRFGRGKVKWDINYMPWLPGGVELTPGAAGGYLRVQVRQAMGRAASGSWKKQSKAPKWLRRFFG